MWKELKCSSTDKWINKAWYINTVKYYNTAIKRDEVPICAMWI